MFNGERLKDCFYEHGYYSKDVCEKIGIEPVVMSRRIKGQTEFKRDEIEAIIKLLKLTPDEVMFYFFT